AVGVGCETRTTFFGPSSMILLPPSARGARGAAAGTGAEFSTTLVTGSSITPVFTSSRTSAFAALPTTRARRSDLDVYPGSAADAGAVSCWLHEGIVSRATAVTVKARATAIQ